MDLDPNAHWVSRLRMIHPILAGALFIFLLRLTQKIAKQYTLSKARLGFPILLCFAFAVGVLTLFSLSPTFMKLSHLFVTNLLLISFYYFAFLSSDKVENGVS